MLSSTLLAAASAMLVSAHTFITFPGTRGDNLITNDTFPYGMQWMYPCGGMPTTTNRTFWPMGGGSLAYQPGWFQGHSTALMYVNLGYGTEPPNMSNPMVPPFQIIGPSKTPYAGSVCLTQIPLPAGAAVQAGDNATIQLVETALHGAALYSCVDITFVEDDDSRLPQVNETNCQNTSDIGFADVYTITTKPSGANLSLNATSGAAAHVARPAGGGLFSVVGWAPLGLGFLWLVWL
ncbi:hypothetical protein P8C59_007728 [Phyllachora maydis]|uniref:Copper acquisition factor BIM1-like domain-containing protein n=1 Tax=Phyllachora maydis TaxID=1825666 RepID=A0AAD9MHB5_9PEZI|nr:hypothetical protein P8C59_007728 [Phyllachora maydis]